MTNNGYLRHIRDLIKEYGDERACVTYNGWHRNRSPYDLLAEIEADLANLKFRWVGPQPGDTVKINGSGDLMFNRSMGKHIGEMVTVIKQCKNGLYLVQTSDGPKSYAKSNLDPILE